ncbi:60S ribosomal protein L8, variant 3 [Schistosoma haematobium]|uniref:Large ribosomal subunit protein uL2 n=1 Tax=Schistosoma haematobium TaxID=6185 RepID=A0A922LSU6_SCHHA|nr:60S ribosomal protein L8, variant 3 [Schistosoma haematobium]KAH9592637.1 60S ribosomal protein L8, variant 3 [Schistosoma haematobium]
MPEGTVVCNLEEKCGDRGRLARASGNYATVVAHNPDTKRTRVKLPSGAKKVLPSTCRAMVGLVAGGGRVDKPILKAGRAYHKYKAKRHCWPTVRGVAMNVSFFSNIATLIIVFMLETSSGFAPRFCDATLTSDFKSGQLRSTCLKYSRHKCQFSLG